MDGLLVFTACMATFAAVFALVVRCTMDSVHSELRAEREARKQHAKEHAERRNTKALVKFGDFTHAVKGAKLRDDGGTYDQITFLWKKEGGNYPLFVHPHHPDKTINLSRVQLVPTCLDENNEFLKLCIHHLPCDMLRLLPLHAKKEEINGVQTYYLNEHGRVVL